MKNILVKTNVNEGQAIAIDSREVAKMLGKEHKYVLRDIEGTDKVVGILPTLIGANLHSSRYFIESEYLDGRNRKNKCYLVTKMGCELLGNKQQGEKGILFTIAYVDRFNQMERELAIAEFKLPTTYKEALLALVAAEEEKELLIASNIEKDKIIEDQTCKVDLYDSFVTNRAFRVREIAKILAIKNLGPNNLFKYLKINNILISSDEAYQNYVEKGYVVHTPVTYCRGVKIVNTSLVLFTWKGIKFLYKKLLKDGYSIDKSIDDVFEEIKDFKVWN